MVPPSNEALRLIIETDADLVDDLNEFYGEPRRTAGSTRSSARCCSTCWAATSLASRGRAPAGMDATRRFMATLQRAMAAAGWKMDAFAVAA